MENFKNLNQKENQNKENKLDRKEFLKKTAGFIGGALIGTGITLFKREIEYSPKAQKEKLEKLNLIEKKLKQIENNLINYEKKYEELNQKINYIFLNHENKLKNKIFIDEYEEYYNILINYHETINKETEKITKQNNDIDILLNQLNNLKYLNSENLKEANKLLENIIKIKQKNLNLQKEYLKLNLNILELIEEVLYKIKPDKNLA
ncbi:MAG: hypothetical protein NZ484_01590 [Patescibacteria group bacterium]|nr:hypothetical protein [Patescibacteria group bacterium]MDW8279988.1 hypothetical protein [bacterium]